MQNKEKLNNILLAENVCESINDNLDFIFAIMPEFLYIRNFEHKHPHHHLDVFNHTLKALEYSPNDLTIRMALLFHDIGKRFCYQEKDGIRHFKGHPKVSSGMTYAILTRLDYDEKFINDIYYLVNTHDTPINVNKLDNDLDLVKKRLEVQFCDAKAHHPDVVEKRLKILNEIKEKLYKIEQ